MSELRTEDEQLDALKNWWNENGRSLLVGIGLALAIVIGWRAWGAYTENKKTEASFLYQSLIEAVQNELTSNQGLQHETINHLVDNLKNDFTASSYSHFASLIQARMYVLQNDYDAALAEIEWVASQTKDTDLQQVAALRKAQVLLELERYSEAEAILNQVDGESYAGFKYELLGDLAFMQNKIEQAADWYDEALALSTIQNSPLFMNLQMKRDDLGYATELR